MVERWKVLIGVAALLILSVEGAQAQQRGRYGFRLERQPTPAAWVGLDFITADPVGEFGQLVEVGFGAELGGRFPIAARGALSLKTNVGFIIYGHERAHLCFNVPIGCRIDTDLVTTNDIVYVGVGPEIAVPTGPIRPYLNGTAGFSYFFTRSSLNGGDDHDFGTTHFDDFVGALTVGGGLRAELKGGRAPIVLDFGLQYHRNGVADYLRKGDILDHPDGSITLFPNRTEANLLTYRIGVSFGIPGAEPGRRRR